MLLRYSSIYPLASASKRKDEEDHKVLPLLQVKIYDFAVGKALIDHTNVRDFDFKRV
jgi:hypothetical protein